MSWRNGGGKLISRVQINPELKQFLYKRPDVFAYGEALIYKHTKEINIRGYRTVVHTVDKRGRRRGIVVYYREKLAEVIMIEHKSKKYDILWLRMKSLQDE